MKINTARQSNALENLSQSELNALHNLAQQQAAAAAEEKEKQAKKGKKGNKKDITPESTVNWLLLINFDLLIFCLAHSQH